MGANSAQYTKAIQVNDDVDDDDKIYLLVQFSLVEIAHRTWLRGD